MKIGVIGAGAIGCWVGGHLARGGFDVVLVGRPGPMAEIDRNGLTLASSAGAFTVREHLTTSSSPEALAGCRFILVAVKSGQTEEAARAIAATLKDGAKDALVISLQNGLRNPDRLRAQLPNVRGGVVGYNVVTEGGGRFRRTTTGHLVIEDQGDKPTFALWKSMVTAGLDVVKERDIAGVQRSKLVMNLNNAVSALTDAPTVQLIFEERYRRIVGAVMGEAIRVFRAAGVKTRRLGPLPVSLFPALLSLPTPLVRVLARAQIQIDPEARSSMWEDLQKRRLTEVDELNGEIVRLAAAAGTTAPLSAAIVDLVHDAERHAAGSPQMTAEDLWLRIHPSQQM